MPSLSLRKIRSRGRPHVDVKQDSSVEHIERTSMPRAQKKMDATATTALEQPPPYELPTYEEAAPDGPPAVPWRASSPAPSIAHSIYRQTHAPPVYRPCPRDRQQEGREAQGRQPRQGWLNASKSEQEGNNLQSRWIAKPAPTKTTPVEGLCQVALEGKYTSVQSFLESGTDVYEISETGKARSAIHAALRGPDPGLALLLLHYPCQQAKMFGSMIPPAGPPETERRAAARLRFLLSLKDGKGCTPLHLAASAGAAHVAREMLELGADVNALDDLNRTPLHMAARFARAETLAVLLEFGANPAMVKEKLWDIVRPDMKDELGDSAFVLRVVTRAVMKRHTANDKSPLEDDESLRNIGWGGCGGAPATENRTPPRPRVEDESDEELARFKRAVRGNVSLAGFSPSAPPVASPSLEGGPLRPGPRLPLRTETLRFNPAFRDWKSTCDIVQEEHRRQKAKNEASGSGAGGLS